MDQQEEFLKLETESGKSTFGVYPPNADTVARYRQWLKARPQPVCVAALN